MIGSEDAEGTKPWAARTLQPNPDVVVAIRICWTSRHSSGTSHL